jgi:hypothetical protein
MRGTVVALMLSLSGPLSAQYLPHHVREYRVSFGQEPRVAADRPLAEDVILSTVGAGLGGVAGFYLLGLTGFYLTGGSDICGDDACGFAGGILAAVFGEAVGIGIGAHLGAGGRGSPVAGIGASLGVLIAAGWASQWISLGEDAIVVVPILQVAAAVTAELMKK